MADSPLMLEPRDKLIIQVIMVNNNYIRLSQWAALDRTGEKTDCVASRTI